MEAQLIDLSDEIAYYGADLDDGFEAKLWGIDFLRQELPLFEQLHGPVEKRYPQATPKLQFNESLKQILNLLATDLMEHSLAQLEQHHIRTVEQVRNHARRLFAFSPAVAQQKTSLRKFLYQNFYLNPVFTAEKKHGEQVVEDLFQFYMDHPEKLPSAHAQQAERNPKYRVVCDYIAGMTDHYIQKLHQELLGGPAAFISASESKQTDLQ